MSRFQTNTAYPLIPNLNEYMIEQRVVSVHSEDRNVTKYPSSSDFELELPDDYVNVSTVKLGNYTFPANYNTFSLAQGNTAMSFTINQPYNPADNNFYDPLLNAIYEALYAHINQNFIITISEGFYNPTEMSNELTGKFNEIVTIYIYNFISTNYPELLQEFVAGGGYTQFKIVYNTVTQKLWFGNKSSGFILTNDSELYLLKQEIQNIQCLQKTLPDFSDWGLPVYLGFSRCPVKASPNLMPGIYPRFYYGDVITPGDNGYWLLPDANYQTTTVYYLEAPAKINLMGNAYFYMEISGFNCIDETSPNNFSTFTQTTNETNGIHNSAFAKIAVTTTPISQWFDSNTESIKIFNPPAERIRRIKIKLRYHNGATVDFGKFNYSFDLIFQVYRPQILRSFMTYNPTSSSISGGQGPVSTK